MLIVLAVFLLSNRDAVAVSFWPFGLLGSLALGAIVLIALAVGLFIGMMLHWPHRLRASRRARAAERQAALLKAQLEAREALPAVPPPVPAEPALPAIAPPSGPVPNNL